MVLQRCQETFANHDSVNVVIMASMFVTMIYRFCAIYLLHDVQNASKRSDKAAMSMFCRRFSYFYCQRFCFKQQRLLSTFLDKMLQNV